MDAVDQRLIREAFRLAWAARERGDRPFGALLAGPDGAVLAEAHDTVVTSRDPTAHAEVNVIRALRGRVAPEFLRRATLYASAEPCAMCAGAVFWSGVRRVVFGLSTPRLHEAMGRTAARAAGDPGAARLDVPCRGIFAGGRPLVEVIGPVFQAEAQEVHRGYWQPG
jgi:tRNA(Arg) A34 adenosine deaminase TadA